MSIGEHFSVIGNWFQILFIENEGMAFGMKFGGMFGKFLLTTFRICLFGFLCWWITGLVRRGYCTGKDSNGEKQYIKVPTGVLVGLTIITAGALGNIIDCLRTAFLRVHKDGRGRIRRQLCPGDVRQGRGHVLLPSHRHRMAGLDAGDRWQAIQVLRTRIQLCRQLRHSGCRIPDSLPVPVLHDRGRGEGYRF